MSIFKGSISKHHETECQKNIRTNAMFLFYVQQKNFCNNYLLFEIILWFAISGP